MSQHDGDSGANALQNHDTVFSEVWATTRPAFVHLGCTGLFTACVLVSWLFAQCLKFCMGHDAEKIVQIIEIGDYISALAISAYFLWGLALHLFKHGRSEYRKAMRVDVGKGG
jgi:hypothetical protein